MNSKHLVIVSLLLAILTVGVVSASDDLPVDEVQTAHDLIEDAIEESPIDNVIEQSDDLDDALEIESGDFNVNIKDSIDLEDENDQVVVNYTVPQDANGKVDVYVDYMGTPSYSRETVSGQSVNITATNLNIVEPSDYHIKLVYVSNSGETLNLAEHTLSVHVYTEDDFGIWYDNWISSKNENIVPHFLYPVVGTLELSVNGIPRYTKEIKGLNEKIHVYLADLNITHDGIYNISAKYIIASTSKEIDLGYNAVEVDSVDWNEDEHVYIFYSADILGREDYFIEIDNNGGYVNGTVSVYVDGTLKLTKNIQSMDEILYFTVTVEDLGLYNNITLGNHTVKVIYMKDNVEKHESEKSVDFYAKPVFVNYFIVSVGEKDVLKVTYIKGFAGIATLYNFVEEQYDDDPEHYYWTKGSVYKSANFVNGVATIPFDSMDEGEHDFILNITGYDDEKIVTVLSKRNSPECSANASASEIIVGNGVVVRFSGPKSDENVNIYLDDVEYNSIPLVNGSVSDVISSLSVGTHRIKVYFNEGDNFYSNTFYVTVKNVAEPVPAKNADKITLTLKKAKVKKSAKKLVLQVTLKINGKAVKGKLIKFKFNKKTYKAKTNKKGVAKVTIKKKVLKKLKVGKKVKYQATYGKITKKATVNVRK